MKRWIAGLTLVVLGYSSALAQGMVAGRVKSPTTIGSDYSMGTPTAVVPTTSATLGAGCSNARTYNWCIAWVSAGGVSPLVCSANWTPSPNTKRATFTIPTPPSNAVGTLIFMHVDNATGQFLISSSGSSSSTTLEGGLRALGTTTVDENCSTGGSKYSYLLTGSANSGQAVIPINPTQGIEVGRQYKLATASGSLSETVTILSVQSNTSVTVVRNLTNSYSASDLLQIKPAGIVADLSINSLAVGTFGFSKRFGGTINSILENAKILDLSGTVAQLSFDFGGTYSPIQSPTRVVNVASAGGAYTSLNAACAAVTSTAGAPVIFVLGPGTFTEQASCSGQDHVAIVGAGMGVTTLTKTGVTGADGTLKLGTSTNVVVMGLTVFGHRAIYWDAATTGGGRSLIRNAEMITELNGNDEDCFFGERWVAGTEIRIEGYRCITDADGLTFNRDGANLSLYTSDGLTTCQGTNSAGMNMWRLGSTPAFVSIKNTTVNCTMSPSTALALTGAHWFGTDTGGASSGVAYLTGNTWVMTHNGTTAGSSLEGIQVDTTSLPTFYDSGHIMSIKGVSANTATKGIDLEAATSAIVTGGYYTVTGGNGNAPFDAHVSGSKITLNGVQYDTTLVNDTGRVSDPQGRTVIFTAPSTCNRGETYYDENGATLCLCTASNTWTDLITGTSPGNCGN